MQRAEAQDMGGRGAVVGYRQMVQVDTFETLEQPAHRLGYRSCGGIREPEPTLANMGQRRWSACPTYPSCCLSMLVCPAISPGVGKLCTRASGKRRFTGGGWCDASTLMGMGRAILPDMAVSSAPSSSTKWPRTTTGSNSSAVLT